MWRIHIKDALTDVSYFCHTWAEVVQTLDSLPANVTGDVTIGFDTWLSRVDRRTRTIENIEAVYALEAQYAE